MRLTWARSRKSPQAPVDRLHFVMWDFLKMMGLAVICGLAVSIAVALAALALSRSAEAAAGLPDASATGTPGVLSVGDGCGGEEIASIDRDWHVSIGPREITVRVMQAFALPAGNEAAASFHVQLPAGARLVGLFAQTASTDWPGHLLPATLADRLDPADYLKITRQRLLVATTPQGNVSTSPLLDVLPGGVVTVAYTYVMSADAAFIDLPLDAGDLADARPAVDDDAAPAGRPGATGNVWVEWQGARPRSVAAHPADVDLERRQDRIDALSWHAARLDAGHRFQLRWTR